MKPYTQPLSEISETTPQQTLCGSSQGTFNAEIGDYGVNTGTGFIQSLLCIIILALGTACSNPAGTTDEPVDKSVKQRHLTVTEQSSDPSAKRMPKVVITDEATTLSASWTAGDNLSYCNLSRQDYDSGTETYNPYTGTLTAAESQSVSALYGDVVCTSNDYLAVVYPVNNTFDFSEPNTYSYSFSLAGQDGTLAKLAASYHQLYGRAYVTSVTDNDANATMPKMKSLLTVCKFSFIDATTLAPIPVSTLTINYNDNTSENGKYPQTATVTVNSTTEHAGVHAVADEALQPLTVTCTSEQEVVYVALMPTGASRTFTFTVTNTSGTYTGTASAQLNEGEFVPATGLKLVKE